MVSPHSDWRDAGEGYRLEGYVKGTAGVFIQPVSADTSGSEPVAQSCAPDDANAHIVELVLNMGDQERINEVATFADARTAWECANLLTRVISNVGNASRVASAHTDDSLPLIVKELSAEDVLRRCLGRYSPRLDGLRD